MSYDIDDSCIQQQEGEQVELLAAAMRKAAALGLDDESIGILLWGIGINAEDCGIQMKGNEK